MSDVNELDNLEGNGESEDKAREKLTLPEKISNFFQKEYVEIPNGGEPPKIKKKNLFSRESVEAVYGPAEWFEPTPVNQNIGKKSATEPEVVEDLYGPFGFDEPVEP